MTYLLPGILSVLSPFAVLFFRPVWNNALTLVIGAILCCGKRTVCVILRIMGLNHDTSFARYRHVFNRVKWFLLQAPKILLDLLLSVAETGNPLVFFVDETLE